MGRLFVMLLLIIVLAGAARAASIPKITQADVIKYCKGSAAKGTSINFHASGVVTEDYLLVGSTVFGQPTIDGYLYHTVGGTEYFEPLSLSPRILVNVRKPSDVKYTDADYALQRLVQRWLQDMAYPCY